jgi:hypothetical protein
MTKRTTTRSSYRKLTDAELHAAVLERPDGRLPPRGEAKALLDEFVRRQRSTAALARAGRKEVDDRAHI